MSRTKGRPRDKTSMLPCKNKNVETNRTKIFCQGFFLALTYRSLIYICRGQRLQNLNLIPQNFVVRSARKVRKVHKVINWPITHGDTNIFSF